MWKVGSIYLPSGGLWEIKVHLDHDEQVHKRRGKTNARGATEMTPNEERLREALERYKEALERYVPANKMDEANYYVANGDDRFSADIAKREGFDHCPDAAPPPTPAAPVRVAQLEKAIDDYYQDVIGARELWAIRQDNTPPVPPGAPPLKERIHEAFSVGPNEMFPLGTKPGAPPATKRWACKVHPDYFGSFNFAWHSDEHGHYCDAGSVPVVVRP